MKGGCTNNSYDEEDIRAFFDTLDEDRTGEIDLQRFMTLIWGMGIKMDEQQIQERIDTVTRRQQQTSSLLFYNIDLVLGVMKELPSLLRDDNNSSSLSKKEDELQEWFQLLDQDGKGYITELDLKQLAEEMDHDQSQQSLEHIRQMMIPFDKNMDGTWNFDDFCHLMKTNTTTSKNHKR